MRSSTKLLLFTFLSLIISSFAHVKDVSPIQAPLASDGSQVSISAASPAPSTAVKSGTTTTPNIGSSVKQWCHFTDYPDLCETTLSPSLIGEKPDLYKALDITVKTAVSATEKFSLAVTKFAGSPQVKNTQLETTMQDSLSSLNNALDNFKQTQDAMIPRDWGTVNTMLSAAISDFGEIEDMLHNEDVPLLMEFTGKLVKMTSNCLALSALFDPQPGY